MIINGGLSIMVKLTMNSPADYMGLVVHKLLVYRAFLADHEGLIYRKPLAVCHWIACV